MNKNPEEYIYNCLNTSLSKFAHSFSKADRFILRKKVQTEPKYTLPSTITKRTCSFGFGNKSSIINDRCSPPPGAYESLNGFDVDKVKLSGPAIACGRDKVLFGSYMEEARKKGNKLPSPSKYDVAVAKNRQGGLMGARLKTDYHAKQQKTVPGPGAYKLKSIQMANSSSFFLSTFKKSTSPQYHSSSSIDFERKSGNNKSVLFYEVQEKEFGKSKSSKFRNVTTSSFGKSKREGPIDKWRLKVPGFKYSAFSEFGTSNR